MKIFFDAHHHFSDRENGIYNLDLNEEIPSNYFSVGIHPHKINENWQQDLEKIKEISQNHLCVAIGECGLDGMISVDEDLQEKVFEQQILWANHIQKPVIIHCVRKFSQLLRFIKIAKTPLVIHGYNKKKETAKELLEKGFFLSFGRALLFNENLQKTVIDIPLEKIFLETDTAEIDIETLYKKLAKLKKMDTTEVEKIISENVKKVFCIN